MPIGYKKAYRSLQDEYAPFAQNIKKQMGTIAPWIQQQTSALDQAKINAFRDITSSANARGMVFGGVPVEEQMRFTGEKYLPALANLQRTGQEQKFGLVDMLNKLRLQRAGEARGIVSEGQRLAIARANQKSLADYRNAQLQMQAARMGGGGGGGGGYYGGGGGGGYTPQWQMNQAALSAVSGRWKPGADNYVNPKQWNALRNEWTRAGFKAYDFDTQFSNLINPAHFQYRELPQYSVSPSIRGQF